MITSKRYTFFSLAPSVVVFAIVLLLPTLYIVNLMFRRESLTRPGNNGYIGFDNFIKLAGDERFWGAVGHSAVFSGVSLAVSIPVGILIALLINRKLRGHGLLRIILIVPMVLAPLVVGAIFRFMFDSNGFVSWTLGLIGIDAPAFLSIPGVSLVTVAFVDAWQWTPFVAIVVAAAMETVPQHVMEAARLDGANAWQELWHFVLPQIRPLLVLVALIRFMDSFREFDKLFIMTNGGPGTSSETLPIYLWRQAFQYLDMGYAAAVGFVVLIIISIICTFIVKFFKASKGVSE
ncbi:carbohydrate ABC transporter permease [Agromyces aerolatus]|uniref:carbohydrate ABC transporter permease n=1 Tax=Agromyces sp. LY-1074 TaxID=3074080 RepID=UPI00285A3F32|nr:MULTISPECIES: sugar ABC transporter permease [unclassified Agromyces]MDR5699559.1 sugar ABC transporter permease [Agromyces sp. LY-1074]MDR5705855.1 sugar ABC transporter permease [Agromyces sp. LY-1358]